MTTTCSALCSYASGGEPGGIPGQGYEGGVWHVFLLLDPELPLSLDMPHFISPNNLILPTTAYLSTANLPAPAELPAKFHTSAELLAVSARGSHVHNGGMKHSPSTSLLSQRIT